MSNMKKLFAMVLAIVMVMSLATTAFAAGETSTLTINTSANHTYRVYQLLVGEVSGLTNGSGTLSNITKGANLNGEIDAFVAAIEGKNGAELGEIAYSYATGDAKYTVVGTGEAVGITVDDGYYVVVDSFTNSNDATDDVLSRYMVAVVGDTTMTPKTSKPGLDKKIVDTDANAAIDESDKTDTAAIGDTIEYEITSAVPDTTGYKYYYYVVHDTMSEGLTLNENSFAVKVGNNTLVKGTDYYVYFNAETNSFDLAFEDMKKLVDTADNGISVGSPISIYYTAVVNDKAEIGLDPNTNTANLEYSNNPGSSERKDKEDEPGIPGDGTATGEGPEYITKTYVTELTILKVDNNGKKLTGAEFTLTGENLNKVIIETNTTFEKVEEGETGEYYKLVNGTYTKTAPSTVAEGEEGYNADLYESTTPEYVRVTTVITSTAAAGNPKAVTAAVNEEGYIIFTGLNAGKYTLTETKTPEGYNTIDPIEFTITATQTGSTALVGGQIAWESDNDEIVLDATNGVFDATIVNMPGSVLPETGGMGTVIFYALGAVLVLAAVVLLVTKKRMSVAE